MCVERAGENAAGAVVGRDERAQLAARLVGAIVGPGRQDDEQPKVVRGRVAELAHQHLDDFLRPQELVLEIDEPLC